MNRDINIELAREKGLIVDDNNELYIIIENLYKYLFEYYLINKVNLKLYDDEILNSNLDFGISHPSNEEKGNILNDYINLKYIYILNNFFIEKLSLDDINKLKESLNIKYLKPNKELLEIINRTYKDVIWNNYTYKGYVDNNYNVYYGEFQPENFVDNDSSMRNMLDAKEPTYKSENRNTVNRIAGIMNRIRLVGLAAAGVFAIIAILVVFNTIRMSIFNRKEEIYMMRLVFYGIISSIVAALVGFFGTFALRDPIGSALMDPTIELMRNNWLYLSAAIMIIGIMIGVISALLATRKYVKVR